MPRLPTPSAQQIMTAVAVLAILYCLFSDKLRAPSKSNMMGLHMPKMFEKAQPAPGVEGTDMDELDDQYAPANLAGTNIDLNIGLKSPF